MKLFSLALIIFIFFKCSYGQATSINDSNKGKLYAYWGWNREWYTNSDLTFKGADFDFELAKVVAKDRQSPFSFNEYLNPVTITIPQYNFRIGYFFSDKYNISIGADHMKYVMQNDQLVKINGEIQNSNTPYDGVYADDDIVLYQEFLTFEHTDGLNYANIEIRRLDEIIFWKKMSINAVSGLGAGLLIPKTNTTLLNNTRHDEFHIAGYGFSAVLGLNLTFFKYFFIQSEFKGGFIHMPDIEITYSPSDVAKQHFFFSQANIVFGGIIKIN